MRRATLDATLDSAGAVHARLARALDLPEFYGANLDALWDVLTRDLPGPIEIVWRDGDRARAVLGETFDRFVALFRAVAAERADFRFRLEG